MNSGDKIRILYIIDYMTTGGGTENQLRALISNLDRNRFEPFLVTLAPMQGWDGLPSYHDPGCDHFCLQLRKIGHPKTIFDILKLARLIRKKKIDIVQTFFVDSNIIGVLAGYLGGTSKIIVSRRDLGFWYTPKLLFILRRINRLADYFMVNSHAIKDTVIEREKAKPERITVIHNGFFNLPDNERSKLTREDLGIPVENNLVGLVANLREVKRIDNFIRMAAGMKQNNVSFMVVGLGPLKEQLLKQAAEAGIADRFKITHTLENIYDYVKLFDIGVLTSDSEGLSNTLVEYQLCGIPAVAFDVGGNREVIEHDKTGFLIKHGDLDDMRSRIELLLSDNSLRSRMGTAARESAKIKFAGDRMIKESSDFYETILRKR